MAATTRTSFFAALILCCSSICEIAQGQAKSDKIGGSAMFKATQPEPAKMVNGFSPADSEAHKGSKGTCKADGGNLEVIWSDGKSSKGELEIVPGGFNWDTGMFAPVEEFTKGKSLVGSYEGSVTKTF